MRGDSLPGFELDKVFCLLVSGKLAPWKTLASELHCETVGIVEDFVDRLFVHVTLRHLPILIAKLKRSMAKIFRRYSGQLDSAMQKLRTVL